MMLLENKYQNVQLGQVMLISTSWPGVTICTKRKTKKWKTEKLKSTKRIGSEVSVNSLENP